MPFRSPFTRLCQLTSSISEQAKADLHVHSTASDGSFSPQEVVLRAREAKLSAVAITDHDTLNGFLKVKATKEIEVIAGVEITAEYHDRELHLLGYFVDPADADLSKRLEFIR